MRNTLSGISTRNSRSSSKTSSTPCSTTSCASTNDFRDTDCVLPRLLAHNEGCVFHLGETVRHVGDSSGFADLMDELRARSTNGSIFRKAGRRNAGASLPTDRRCEHRSRPAARDDGGSGVSCSRRRWSSTRRWMPSSLAASTPSEPSPVRRRARRPLSLGRCCGWGWAPAPSTMRARAASSWASTSRRDGSVRSRGGCSSRVATSTLRTRTPASASRASRSPTFGRRWRRR